MNEVVAVTAQFLVPERYRESMAVAIENGDYSWVRELLDYCDLDTVK